MGVVAVVLRYGSILALCLVVAAWTGCIELRAALLGAVGDAPNGGSSGNGGDDEPEDDAGETFPSAALRASNVTPQVDEEVALTCSLTEGDPSTATFDFQPADGRLFVDHTRGRASFIVDQADIGASFAFTCTATDSNGTGPRSNQVVITPS